MNGSRLTLCMIVRDSSRTLEACLASIRPWVDEIVVVDTGSVDDTRQIAKRFGADVYEFLWIDDFAAGRNESLRHARGEWLFWMDSDDTIDAENSRRLRELADGAHPDNIFGYVVQVHCPATATEQGEASTTVVDHVKLIRNDPRIRFEGRIHEQVLPSIRRLGGEIGWTDLFVVHSGSDQTPEGKARKIERDLRILKQDAKERPDHPFVLFNLGMTYEDIGQYAEAENWLHKCLAVSSAGESHLRKAYALLASCHSRQGRHAEAHATCRHALELFPDDEELLFRRGVLDHMARDVKAAEQAYRAILNRTAPRHFTSIDRGLLGHKTRHNLALVLEDRGAVELAEIQWRMACDEVSDFEPARLGLASLFWRQGKQASLAILLDQTAVVSGQQRQTEPAQHEDDPLQDSWRSQSAAGATSIAAPALSNGDAAQATKAAEVDDWPPCHSRRFATLLQGSICQCAHPLVATPQSIVTREVCLVCPLRLEPAPAQFRECPPPRVRRPNDVCAHLGAESGLKTCESCSGNVRLKVFACRHERHGSTTLVDCQRCEDFISKDQQETGAL